ncbi:MAG: hypothetical protein IPG39_00315 [Bacteroidetes bacterium]|nr:hypothetical protein [Bacteroidota bacterium]
MKTLTTIAATLLMFMLSTGSKAEVSVPIQNNPSRGTLVKAEMVKGELIPVVDLPAINVTATRPGYYVIKCIIRDGQVFGEVYLHEVEITASKPALVQFRVHKIDGELLAYVNLPIVEIQSELNINGLEKAILTEKDQIISVIDLPQITITATALNPAAEVRSIVFDISGLESNFDWLTAQPLVINIQNSALASLNLAFSGRQLALANCIMESPGKVACELISSLKK